MNPTPTPPNMALIIMSSMKIPPDNGVWLSCMEFTEPLEVAVVDTPHREEATGPNRTSFPSIFAVCSSPMSANRGFPITSWEADIAKNPIKNSAITPKM